jgi:diaminopimelate epimerase
MKLMEFRFSKMHGAGNDFVMINDMDERCSLSPGAISRLCSRHRGIGGDGLILIRPSAMASFAMRYFNSDGAEADMCGNGARCAAAFAYENGIAHRSMLFESRAGAVSAEILDDGVLIRIADVRNMRLDMMIASASLPVHFGICGVPHAVIVNDDLHRQSHDDFVRFARGVRQDPALGTAGANVNVVTIAGSGQCRYRTYERGVEDETLACGTGAVVVATVLVHLKVAESPIICETGGGDRLEVAVTRTASGATDCRLKGPVAISFRGTFRIEDYERI